jgi:hypothetical protein
LLAHVWLAALIAAVVTRVVASLVPEAPISARLLHASVVVPALGIAVLLPLSLHALWFRWRGLPGFDDWVWWSILLTGPAHLAFAAMTVRRAHDLAMGREPTSVVSIYGAAILLGSLPIPIVPSILVAITGLPILPLLWWMKPLIRREREALNGLPRAQASRGKSVGCIPHSLPPSRKSIRRSRS